MAADNDMSRLLRVMNGCCRKSVRRPIVTAAATSTFCVSWDNFVPAYQSSAIASNFRIRPVQVVEDAELERRKRAQQFGDIPARRQSHPMKIQKDTVVSVRYKVAEPTGRLIEESKSPMVYLHGGYDNTLPKIEEALEGKEAGHEVTLQLEPKDAFGERDEALVRTIPRSEFPPGVKVGGQLEGRTDAGEPHVFHVTKIKGQEVHLDGNHPLAGKTLKFVLKVTGVRAATPVEIEHRHVHGEGGHHH